MWYPNIQFHKTCIDESEGVMLPVHRIRTLLMRTDLLVPLRLMRIRREEKDGKLGKTS